VDLALHIFEETERTAWETTEGQALELGWRKDNRIDVNVTMTSAACPVTDTIIEDIETQLDAALPPDMLIHVELVWEPPWTPERMSDTARGFMGW